MLYCNKVYEPRSWVTAFFLCSTKCKLEHTNGLVRVFWVSFLYDLFTPLSRATGMRETILNEELRDFKETSYPKSFHVITAASRESLI